MSAHESQRIASLDVLKIVAAFAVVYIHAPCKNHPFPADYLLQMSRWAVPCFFVVAGFFFTKSLDRYSLDLRKTLNSFIRILQPFFFWALLYAIIPPFIGGSTDYLGADIVSRLQWILRYPFHFIIFGNVYHLWFLSSLLQAYLVVYVCLRFANLKIALALGSLLYAVALLGTTYANTPWGIQSHYVFKDGPYISILFVALGALIARHATFLHSFRFAWLALLLGGLLLQGIEHLYLGRYGASVGFCSYMLGFVPFALGCVLIAIKHPEWEFFGLANLGKYALGIYVMHPYVINLLGVILGIKYFISPYFITIFAFGISLNIVVFLSRLNFMRRFVM